MSIIVKNPRLWPLGVAAESQLSSVICCCFHLAQMGGDYSILDHSTSTEVDPDVQQTMECQGCIRHYMCEIDEITSCRGAGSSVTLPVDERMTVLE
jgi:hypothetical protein